MVLPVKGFQKELPKNPTAHGQCQWWTGVVIWLKHGQKAESSKWYHSLFSALTKVPPRIKLLFLLHVDFHYEMHSSEPWTIINLPSLCCYLSFILFWGWRNEWIELQTICLSIIFLLVVELALETRAHWESYVTSLKYNL